MRWRSEPDQGRSGPCALVPILRIIFIFDVPKWRSTIGYPAKKSGYRKSGFLGRSLQFIYTLERNFVEPSFLETKRRIEDCFGCNAFLHRRRLGKIPIPDTVKLNYPVSRGPQQIDECLFIVITGGSTLWVSVDVFLKFDFRPPKVLKHCVREIAPAV